MVSFAVALAALVGGEPPARAGCICADITNVRVGDLEVSKGEIRRQTWTVSNAGVQLDLDLTGASAATTVEVLAMGIPAGEVDGLRQSATANQHAGDDPRATAVAGGVKLAGKVTRQPGGDFQLVRMQWKLGTAAGGDASIKVSWSFPAAGEDEMPDGTKERIRDFCIDAGTRKAMKKKADGYHRVDLVLSPDMARQLTLRVERGPARLPLSLCAERVVKRGAQLFEVIGRENLQDRGGILPILFSATI